MFRLYVILQNEYSHETITDSKKEANLFFLSPHRKSCILLNVTIFENNAVAIICVSLLHPRISPRMYNYYV